MRKKTRKNVMKFGMLLHRCVRCCRSPGLIFVRKRIITNTSEGLRHSHEGECPACGATNYMSPSEDTLRNPRVFAIGVTNCARCGKNHREVEFKRFKNKADRFTHFGTCPVTLEPILMQYSPEPGR